MGGSANRFDGDHVYGWVDGWLPALAGIILRSGPDVAVREVRRMEDREARAKLRPYRIGGNSIAIGLDREKPYEGHGRIIRSSILTGRTPHDAAMGGLLQCKGTSTRNSPVQLRKKLMLACRPVET
jgi:hypothetical protein